MKQLVCRIKGHDFQLTKKGQHSAIKEFQCPRCKQKFTQDGYGQMVKLTKYWEQNNRLFEAYYQKRIIS